MAIDLPIKGASFPMEAIAALKLKREPHIDKTPVGQDDTQFVDIGDNRLEHDVDKLHLGDLTQSLDIDQTHTTPSSRCKRESRLCSRWSQRCRSRHESASSRVPSR